MVFRQVLQRILSQQTSEHQQKLIQQLSETELMMKAARKTHEVVQKVSSQVDQIRTGALPKGPSSRPADASKPLHHEQLTAEDHAAAAQKFDFASRLQRAKEQVKSDAAADWQDIKNMFKRK